MLLSGDHLGGWAFFENKFTSEYGIPDSDSKQGRSLSAKSVWKKTNNDIVWIHVSYIQGVLHKSKYMGISEMVKDITLVK